MKVLIVKLSSLGDVVHAMAAVQDIRLARPDAQIDWVVDKAFAPLVRRCAGVGHVIECDLRSWRKSPLSSGTRIAWRRFRKILQSEAYDAVIDLQGLTKSALVARLAVLEEGGKRYAMANRTEGSSYEAPTRWVADVALRLEPHIHAVQRSRVLCALALDYAVPEMQRFGLMAGSLLDEWDRTVVRESAPTIALVHGASRADKLWPVSHWLELGRRLHGRGFALALPHGNDEEQRRSEGMAREFAVHGVRATVWPRVELDVLLNKMADTVGVIGVDSGLSHVAVALGLPHVQIYNFDTAWRTGPQYNAQQQSVHARPAPDVNAVWSAWLAVEAERSKAGTPT